MEQDNAKRVIGIMIGSDKDAIVATYDAIAAILIAETSDEVKLAALDTLRNLCAVSHVSLQSPSVTIHNGQFAKREGEGATS